MTAIVFTRSCGAITRSFTELSIMPASSDAPSGSGNTLDIGDDPKHPIQRSTEQIDVRLHWISNRSLSVSFPREAVVGRQVSRIGGVTVEYTVY
jgi:hypothetical protein